MDNLRVGMDIDGVLAQFNPAYIKLIREAGFTCPDEGTDFPNCWAYDKQAGMDPESIARMWTTIKKDPTFWLRLDPYPDTIEFLAELHVLPIDVYFISNRFGKNAKWQTEQWLRSYGVRNPTVLVTSKKAQACNLLEINMYIDDYDTNCRSVVCSTLDHPMTFMLERPWNRNCEVPKDVIRIKSIHEFLDHVKSELKNRKDP